MQILAYAVLSHYYFSDHQYFMTKKISALANEGGCLALLNVTISIYKLSIINNFFFQALLRMCLDDGHFLTVWTIKNIQQRDPFFVQTGSQLWTRR